MTRPEFNPGSSVAPTWVGGMSLDSLTEGIRLNKTGSTQQSVDNQRFWCSPPRYHDELDREVMQITLATARRLNKIEFDVAAFPQDITAEYYDERAGEWRPCLDDLSSADEHCLHGIRDSVPSVLPPASAVRGHLHPQHSYTGHWRTVTFFIKPILAKTIRLVLTRTGRGTPPKNRQGGRCQYSLAVRNLKLSYIIRKHADIPRTPPQGDQRETFASTNDLFGSIVDFSVRVNVATNAIGTTTGINGLNTIWKSEPQPIPWAVVNYYCDIRDAQGEGQILDRFFLDPIFDGPTCNLYWSNDEPTDAFKSNADPIPSTIASVNNSAGVTGNVLNFDNPTLANAIAFVELTNQGIGFDPSRPWWLGGQLNFKFAHGTQIEDHPIFDCGAFTLTWTPLGPKLSTAGGDALLVKTETAPATPGGEFPVSGSPTFIGFDPATPLSFMAWSDTTNIGIAIKYGVIEFAGTLPLSVPLGTVTAMRVGAFLGSVPGAPKSRLQGLVLKTDTSPSNQEIEDFLRDPFPYVLNGEYLDVNDMRTDNALFRYHPSFYSVDSPTSFVGGAPDRYAFMEWSPIARDYVLRKGYLYLPPTRAKYWKLEFTNLSPQPYEVYQVVDKTVHVFPSEQWRKAIPSSVASTSDSGLNELMPGRDNIYLVNTLSQTLDNGRTAVVGTHAKKSNTTARVIYDNDVRHRISKAYWAWSFLPLHHTGSSPCWEFKGVHNYQVIKYQQKTKLAFFVGLRSIQAFKLNYINTDDTNQYVELFHNLDNVDPNSNWILPEDHLFTSGGSGYSEARGKVFPSNRVVTAVQFASQQSEPVQLLPDADLADPTMASWEAVGDAVISDSSGLDPTLASTKRINRSLPALTWGWVADRFVTFGAIISQTNWGAISVGPQTPTDAGGISSRAIALPQGGRVHVAARATADVDLTVPLSVQLVDADSGRVLADAKTTVKSGQIAEWFANYTIGEGVDPVPWIWRDFATGYSTIGLNSSFTGPNAVTLPPLDSGQLWSWPLDGVGAELSLDLASNAATVTTEGQYDYVNAGNPWGTLQVTLGTTGTTSTGLIALLRLNPLFVTEKGLLGVLSGSGMPAARGYVFTTTNTPYTVVPGDVIRVDFLPADYVPADKLDVTGSPYDQYAMMFWVNGVWKATRTHNFGALLDKGIKGRLNQKFTKFSFTPANYGPLQGAAISGMPRKGNGDWLDSATQQTWRAANGRMWYVGSSNTAVTAKGTWDATNVVETASRDDIGTTLVASSNNAVVWTDTTQWNGNLTFCLRHIAGTNGSVDPAGRTGMVACLDFDAGIYLDAQGNLVQGATILQTGFYPGGIPLNKNITVIFAEDRLFTPGSATGRTVRIVTDSLLVGTAVSSAVSLMTGTKRGLAGGLWTGTRPGGANYTIDTAFQSFNWSPIAKMIAQTATGPTWGSVTRNGTVTYQEVLAAKDTVTLRVKARVVQEGVSGDTWDVDNISVYADPIIWSFSNDGGSTFIPAYEIRNNPSGVLVFPPIQSISLNQKPGNALVWRVVSYKPGSNVSSLVIRPWYGGMFSGVDHRSSLVAISPNIMPYDQFGDIRKDARFQTWNSPIPRSWWYQFQIIDRVPTTGPDPAPPPTQPGYPGDEIYPGDNVYPGVSS